MDKVEGALARPRWRIPAAVLLTAALLASGACSRNKAKPRTAKVTNTTAGTTSAAPTSTTRVTTTASAPPANQPLPLLLPRGLTAEQKQVARAYRDAIAAFLKAGRAPSASAALVGEHFAGPAYREVMQRLAKFTSTGSLGERPVTSVARLTLESIVGQGGSAQLRLCEVDDGVVVSAKTGMVLNDAISAYHTTVEMRLIKNKWRVTQRQLVGPKRAGTSCTH